MAKITVVGEYEPPHSDGGRRDLRHVGNVGPDKVRPNESSWDGGGESAVGL